MEHGFRTPCKSPDSSTANIRLISLLCELCVVLGRGLLCALDVFTNRSTLSFGLGFAPPGSVAGFSVLVLSLPYYKVRVSTVSNGPQVNFRISCLEELFRTRLRNLQVFRPLRGLHGASFRFGDPRDNRTKSVDVSTEPTTEPHGLRSSSTVHSRRTVE